MSDTSKLRNMMEPLYIGQVEFKNRIVKPGQSMKFAEKDGLVTERIMGFYEALARGGVGMIVVENSCVADIADQGPYSLRVDDDKHIPSLSKLADAIHKHQCPAFLQLGHSGATHKKEYAGLQPVSSSALTPDELPIPNLELPREITVSHIRETVHKYAEATARAKKAGFDGIEIHAAHNYFLNSFLSCIWNKRSDSYGGQSIENRARIIVEIITAIKEHVGHDYPVGIRINGAEWGREKATTGEDSREISKLLEKAGADYIHVTGFGYGTGPYAQIKFPEQLLFPEPVVPLANQVKKPGALVHLAAAIKQAVSIPVITVGRLDPFMGEHILDNEMADLIAMGRRLIADPDLPNKTFQGKWKEVAPCTACLECLERLERGEPAQCRINASLGREQEYAITPAVKRKRVVVIGGGVAGMEAAMIAAKRGHDVTVYEKERKLGGLVRLAALIKGLEVEPLMDLVKYFKTEFARHRVKTRLGREATVELLENINPDVAVIGIGGIPAIPAIPGIDGRRVMSTTDLKRRSRFFLMLFGPRMLRWLTKFWLPIGKRVVVIGGLIQGCETAEFLVQRNRKVTIIEASDGLGTGIPGASRIRLLTWLSEKGVQMLTGATVEQIVDNNVVVKDKDGVRRTFVADTIVPALPLQPNAGLSQALQGKVPEVYLIGDSNEPAQILEAVAAGARVGRDI